MSKLEKTFHEIQINHVMMSKHPRIILNAAGMFLCGAGLTVPVDGIPAGFFSRVRIRK